jgi:hypothetical protein
LDFRSPPLAPFDDADDFQIDRDNAGRQVLIIRRSSAAAERRRDLGAHRQMLPTPMTMIAVTTQPTVTMNSAAVMRSIPWSPTRRKAEGPIKPKAIPARRCRQIAVRPTRNATALLDRQHQPETPAVRAA